VSVTGFVRRKAWLRRTKSLTSGVTNSHVPAGFSSIVPRYRYCVRSLSALGIGVSTGKGA
jgi:hypothetical protein